MPVCMELNNRATRGKITVLDNREGDIAPLTETKDNKWAVKCEAHDTVVFHKNRALAFAAAPKPDWCKGCDKIMKERKAA